MKYQYKNKILYFYFQGDFDYMNIEKNKWQIIDLIDQTKMDKVLFDFRDITFVDSTGIGFVIARFKQCAQKNVELLMANLANEHRIIFDMSGIFQIIKLVDNEVRL
ncbi:MAG: STAS domain-containing protein [Erysipelotrichia bacterium]|nr:STAS domain-containing protein [Erysipelotrichia bacterium]NCC54896.1 STAS domain-containing protein [Erysipelotrichia bacterium]